MEDAPKLVKIPKIGMSRHMDTSTTPQMAENLGPVWKTPVVPLERNLYGHPLARLFWELQFDKNSVGARLVESSQLWMFICTPWKGIILVNVCGWLQKLAGKKQKILIRCGTYFTNKLIWEEPTSFLDHVYLGCTQGQCETSKDIAHNDRTMFESRMFAGATEKNYQARKKLNISTWSYDMEGHAKNVRGTFIVR